ncbi:acyl-CoA-binding domain-containing protein 3-like [Impatiens glandulifera]|uniref:acyl-CoA-binding domain-containing protein 3-like n=1 Tax=Impatiens glandulifera TaxID=253017 RepID=UPI001FB163A3|nr:acyl-CoA-binding domain-containing protein 3-like [Impatiens glandulifera]
MELLLDLLLTLFVAVLLSFLIAKLISFASAGDDQQSSESASGNDLDGTEFLSPELTVEEEEEECRFRYSESQNTERMILQGVHEQVHHFDIIESVNKLESSISSDELVQEQLRESAATNVVVVGSLEKSKSTEIVFISREFPVEIAQEVEVKGEKIESDETTKENLISMVSTRFDESGAFGEVKAVNSLAEEDKIIENVDVNDRIGNEEEVDETTKENLISMVSTRFDESCAFGEVKAVNSLAEEDKIIENVDVNDRIGNEEEVDDTRYGSELNQGGDGWSDGNEDDWEGVEQSKLQKVFNQASKFVAGMSEDIWGNDLHMQLYGLHKVALEGPCQEPQPMAIKLSARSKWVESCYM